MTAEVTTCLGDGYNNTVALMTNVNIDDVNSDIW